MKKTKITTLMFGILLALMVGVVSAHEHDFTVTKQIIDSGIACDKLTDEQLEAIGDYYMEQMHPGEAHEMMDKMMGGEGSEILKQMHIQMTKRLYCNEDTGGMMNMMGGGMMGNWGYWSFNSILYTILLIGLVILVYLWIFKLWKNRNKK